MFRIKVWVPVTPVIGYSKKVLHEIFSLVLCFYPVMSHFYKLIKYFHGYSFRLPFRIEFPFP